MFCHFSNTFKLSGSMLQNFYVDNLDMTGQIFQSQDLGNSPKWRSEGFGLNFLVAEEQHSLFCRNTQYWGRPQPPKLSQNGSRMDDMRNRDRENDRTGPRSIFRPLPDPTNQKNDQKSTKMFQSWPELDQACH